MRTLVDSFSIVGGELQESPYNVSAVEASALPAERRGRGSLYALVETIGGFPDHTEMQRQIIEVAQQYFGTTGSITAGIRTAIKAANTYLFEHNLSASPEERGVAGLTLLVLKDADAYVGQIGPALLYHIGKGEFRRLPPESTWLTSETLEGIDTSKHPPLGLRREVEPELSHLYVQEGDTLILASSSLAKLASDDEVRHAVTYRGGYSVCETLQSLSKGQDVCALVVELLEVAPAAREAKGASLAARPSQPAGFFGRLVSRLRQSLLPVHEEPEHLEDEEAVEEEQLRRPSIDLRGLSDGVWRLLQGLGRALLTLAVRVLPEAEPGQRRQQARRPQPTAEHSDRKWLWAALLIPVLILGIFSLTRYQHERAHQNQIRQLWEEAQDAKTSAQISTSRSEQRTKLAEAMAALDKALALKPGDESMLAEKEAIQAWLDRINRVVRLTGFNALKEFPDTEAAKSQVGSVIVQGIDVYVLDLGLDRVYKYLLTDTRDAVQTLPGDPVLVRKGDQHGNLTLDEMLDIAWVQSGVYWSPDSLFVVDRKGRVLSYEPAIGLKPLPPADISQWREPVAVAGYFGRIYVLDPPANRILRYSLTRTGYEGPPTDYLKPQSGINISDAVDLAIDGDVYVLHADGRVSKYHDGASVPFSQTGLEQPLKSPCCLFVTGAMGEGGNVYVVDAGNGRVVQFSKSGEFIREFRSRTAGYMEALRGLFVDEAGKRFYLVDRNKLFWVALPD